MKYDIVEDDIKIGNKIIYGIDKDILDIIHSLEKENQELKADYGSKVQVERDMLQQENQKYKEVIDKAIEYIKGAYEMALYTKSVSLEEENIEELLDILKEVE